MASTDSTNRAEAAAAAAARELSLPVTCRRRVCRPALSSSAACPAAWETNAWLAHRCDWYLLAWPVMLSSSSTRIHSSLAISSSWLALPAGGGGAGGWSGREMGCVGEPWGGGQRLRGHTVGHVQWRCVMVAWRNGWVAGSRDRGGSGQRRRRGRRRRTVPRRHLVQALLLRLHCP